MEKLLKICQFLYKNRIYLILAAVLLIFIAVKINNNQRIQTLDVIGVMGNDMKDLKGFMVDWRQEDRTNDSLTKIIINHLPTAKPIDATNLISVSSEYGMRKKPGADIKEFHTGEDYRANKGTPVIATGAGVILSAKWTGGYGRMVKIDHSLDNPLIINAGFYPVKAETWYGHLNTINVRENQTVNKGDTIGTVGSTGNSTGYHLHYELWSDKRINPNFFN
jgi:murein DD-endopeptidase MepM/ murein hydrolase activator NlpD